MTVIRWWGQIRCRFPTAADPVVKDVYAAPISICHAALAAFIDKPDLLRHWNTAL